MDGSLHCMIRNFMSKKFKTIITGKVPENWASVLMGISRVDIWPGKPDYLMPREKLIRELKDVDAIVNFAEVQGDRELVENAPLLKIIANASIGYDNLDLEDLAKAGIWATNSPGFMDVPVAEYIIAGILSVSRKLGEADRFVREGKWTSFEPGRWDGQSLREQTIGIIGMGAIGKELARMAQCIGMSVRHYDAFVKTLPGYMELDELITTSDIVSVNVPFTPETRGMVDFKFLEKLKSGAILVNTSRGTVVVQKALMVALQNGRLRGAVLDVFENEPEVPEELRYMYNVVLTPHMAGGTVSSRKVTMENAIRNVFEVLSGNPPLNPVNKR